MLKYYSFAEATGYGLSALAYVQGLRDSGADLCWQPMTWDGTDQAYSCRSRSLRELEAWLRIVCPSSVSCADVIGTDRQADCVLLHTVPEYWPRLVEAGKPCVGYTVWETDRIPGHWDGLLGSVDKILTPSRQSKNVLQASGCRPSVRVVPHLPSAEIESGETDTRHLDSVLPANHYVFYTIDTWQPRKGMELLLHAFLLSFAADDPVILYIKTSPAAVDAGNHHRMVSVVDLIEGIRSNYPDAARIVVDTKVRSGPEMAALHQRGRCYVSLTRAEGWGMAAFDAAWAGTPIIMTGYGGQLDYLDGRYCQLVDYDLTPVRPNRLVASYSQDQRWAEADLDSAMAAMRNVFEDPGRAERNARALATLVRRKFSREETLRRLREALYD
jgi:glycosyltransferase involved in cell wall biosynthesis